jgi:hypothetical protein
MPESNTTAGAEAISLEEYRGSGLSSNACRSTAFVPRTSQDFSSLDSTSTPGFQKSAQPYPDFTTAERKNSPWKYEGYRVFSKWIASDEAFFIVRQFGSLNARVILSMQDELVQLEEELDTLDKKVSRKGDPDTIHNGSFRLDGYRRRKVLLTGEITDKLGRYSMCEINRKENRFLCRQVLINLLSPVYQRVLRLGSSTSSPSSRCAVCQELAQPS